MASLVSAPASLARLARPIHGEDEVDQLLDLVAPARIVMLGAASYGTHEHYDLRASLTRKLIGDRGFSAVVVEGDWPDALRVDRYVRNQSDDDDAEAALAAFDHFPSWAWRNDEVARFVEWLHTQNYIRRPRERVGFYGLDLYSMNASLRAMRTHLDVSDDDLITELCDMQWRHAARSGRAPSGEAWLHAIQKAHSRDARPYYTTLLAGGAESWNLRSLHMADTLDMLALELGSHDEPAKLVVWGHNMHVGDARAQSTGRTSVGQHMRERHGDEVALVGFTTYEGAVHVAPEWDEPANDERLPPSHAASWEALFHETGLQRFMISGSALRRAITEEPSRPHRGIGAIMLSDPYTETRLADHYDLVVHVDTTRAIEPIAAVAPDETHAMSEAHVRASAD
jgi:erythromycin esterase-like protein